ncbi:hypothetical protein [Mycoplasmopsis cynos]|uniref:hypothetical protein n=1 Tax=Mycoplasmopsis cynos TaxID=171284 RepID=UPI002968CDEA|nr:hypothetical protein [Mycoplasmopsis cynos]MCU9933346.1 hypothetical protein [Mycoplasmopsis cynos]WQQ17249.1 hypothetical protein RRG39_01745 [Mycoplasmopsis cynos]WQQ17998.1 hypothetical protein RRG56_01660 [Mycoplasmopsis cynos]
MQKRFKLKLWFSSLCLVSLPLISISCSAETRTRNSISELNNYLKSIKNSHKEKYKYFIPVLEFSINSLNKFVNETNDKGYYISENAWNNINAQVKARYQLFLNVQKELDKLQNDQINDPNKGIKSERFLELYYFIHSQNDPEFKIYNKAIESFSLTQWWINYSKAFLFNYIIKKTPGIFDLNTFKVDLKPFYDTTMNIYNAAELIEPKNEITAIDVFVKDYETKLDQLFQTINHTNQSSYKSVFSEYTFIKTEYKKIQNAIQPNLKLYFELIQKIRHSYFQTLEIKPILSDDILTLWDKFFTNLASNINKFIFEYVLYKFNDDDKHLRELLTAIGNLTNSNDAYMKLNEEAKNINYDIKKDSKFNQKLQKVIDQYFNQKIMFDKADQQISKYIINNKKG